MDEEKYLALVLRVENEFPGFDIKLKSTSTLMKACDIGLKLITFWRMKRFMVDFFTTIGYTVYVPDALWSVMDPPAKAVLMRHERVHMRQRRKHGMLLFSFLYLFFPLPMLFAYYRMKFEREAYAESLCAYRDYHGLAFIQTDGRRRAVLRNFTSASYFWMWPWRGGNERWYDSVVESLKP